ncbi:MAG: MotA/TolQ/ExbB proton channel family protein [Candidatus Competibacterales bacterium]
MARRRGEFASRLRGVMWASFLGLLFLFGLYYALASVGGDVARFSGELLLGTTPAFDRLWPFPFTVQGVMWIVFFWGLAELLQRYRASRAEEAVLDYKFLPEDEQTILLADDLGPIYRRLRQTLDQREDAFLYRLIQRIVFQFQNSRSIDQANSLLNSSLELFNHEVDLRYSLLRYVTWLIPTLGFIGTVIGIALALAYAGSADFQDPNLLNEVTSRLAVAFNTTLIALLLSAVLVFLMHVIQAREEEVLNRIGQYCLDNLINRLYVSERD